MALSHAFPSFLTRPNRAKPSPVIRTMGSRTPVTVQRGPEPEPSLDTQQLESIGRSSAQLAAMGPRLAALAGQMEKQANEQARHAAQIAEATAALAGTLTAVVGRLQSSATNVHDVMADIARIADQTRILSINASIEAGRAGEHGRTFAVVAQEVQQLADKTRHSTNKIEERIEAIQTGVREVAASVDNDAATGTASVTVHAVSEQVRAMAGTAASQRDGAHALHELGGQANHLAEELLLAVGTFRLAVHARAARALEAFLPTVGEAMPNRQRLEQLFHGWLQDHSYFELLYVTDGRGRQIVDNIGWQDGETWADPKGFGRDWRERPWYQDAVNQPEEVSISDIYRSTATGDFCFTASAVVRDADGTVLGVLGADVNFQKLITGDKQR